MASNTLKKILQEEGITQADLHKHSGVSTTTINKVCNQKRTVAPTTQSKLIIALNKLTRMIKGDGAKQYSREEIFESKK